MHRFHNALSLAPQKTRLLSLLMFVVLVTGLLCGSIQAANFTVTTIADSDDGTCDADCSLREAINAANTIEGTDFVEFTPRLEGVIMLASALPELGTELRITGPIGGHVTINGNNAYRVFLVNSTGKVTLRNLHIANGFTLGYGGGVYTSGTLLMENCTLSNNFGENGGGFFTYAGWSQGTTTVRNCTFTHNSASRVGGGVFCYYGDSTFESCTIVGNTAPDRGGSGLASIGDTLLPTNTRLRNCIVASNTNSDVDMVFGGNITLTSDGYNLIGDGLGATAFNNNDQIIGNGDPGVEPLLDYGGFILTMALRKDSPALNSGNTTLSTDQRGIRRPVGGADDIGAFEWQAATVSVGYARVVEGSEGTTELNIPVTRIGDRSEDVSVNYAVFNGSARSGFDYSDVSDTDGGTVGTVTLRAGETIGAIKILVIGDTLHEIYENLYVVISMPVNCTISGGRGMGTIEDDDPPPSISIDDVLVQEGHDGLRLAVFRLKLSAPSGQIVQVNYSTRIGGQSAVADVDFQTVSSGPIYFTTGSIYAYARVNIIGDLLHEADERFEVNLHNAGNASIADSIGIATILNDDRPPALTINDVAVSEGNSGTTNLNFTVSLSQASAQAITVNFVTANGVARSTSDYTAKSGTLTFNAGQTSKTVSIVINGDTIVEGDETLFVLLSGATNASLGRARGAGTIFNDDASGSGLSA